MFISDFLAALTKGLGAVALPFSFYIGLVEGKWEEGLSSTGSLPISSLSGSAPCRRLRTRKRR
jgi:hypothetical protein